MEIKRIVIAEHVIEIRSDSSELMTFIHTNYEVIKNYMDQPNITILLEEGYGKPFVNYNVQFTEENGQISYQRTDYKITINKDYKEATIAVYDLFALKHALLNLYSSYIVHFNWGLLIHSSCIISDEKAHIFSGHSGAGKSTAARLSSPRELLSDEATIVKITHDEVIIFNSPFRSELSTTNYQGWRTLASIQLLYQDISNKRIHLKKSDGFLQLMDKVFFWDVRSKEMNKIINLLHLLVQQVPIFNLHFQKNDTFWELIS
ncbi:hypothetical protein [Bacillus sp. PS06]|uniref:hypothetical protein n=1 Tax=Bacillus sp. PS06 TaxID=2764176 RepID=UPI00177AA58C|nr:hypothetical protein [Bacillus sp. PS06]MBD8071118.1 hypothetical protein [Bacillus sp. PS06]